jgi:hypothetical protein
MIEGWRGMRWRGALKREKGEEERTECDRM